LLGSLRGIGADFAVTSPIPFVLFHWDSDERALSLKCHMAPFLSNLHKTKVVAEDLDEVLPANWPQTRKRFDRRLR